MQHLHLQEKLISFRKEIVEAINSCLDERQHEKIVLNETLTNNWVDKINNEQIFSYERESGMLGVECMEDTFHIYIESIKIETLVDLLASVEEENYKVENDED